MDSDLAIATSRSWSVVAGRLRDVTSCVETLTAVRQSNVERSTSRQKQSNSARKCYACAHYVTVPQCHQHLDLSSSLSTFCCPPSVVSHYNCPKPVKFPTHLVRFQSIRQGTRTVKPLLVQLCLVSYCTARPNFLLQYRKFRCAKY